MGCCQSHMGVVPPGSNKSGGGTRGQAATAGATDASAELVKLQVSSSSSATAPPPVPGSPAGKKHAETRGSQPSQSAAVSPASAPASPASVKVDPRALNGASPPAPNASTSGVASSPPVSSAHVDAAANDTPANVVASAATAAATASRPLSPEEARALSPADLRELCVTALGVPGKFLRKIDGTGALSVSDAHAFNASKAVKANLETRHLSAAQLRELGIVVTHSSNESNAAVGGVVRSLPFDDVGARGKRVGGLGDEEDEVEDDEGDDDNDNDGVGVANARPTVRTSSRNVDMVKEQLREDRLGQRTPIVLGLSGGQDRYTRLMMRCLPGTTSIAVVEPHQIEALGGPSSLLSPEAITPSSVVSEATRLGLLRPNDSVLRYEDSTVAAARAVINPRVGRSNAAAIQRALETGNILSPECLVHVQLDHAVECQSTSSAVRRAFAAHTPVPDWAADVLASGPRASLSPSTSASISPLMANFLAPLVPLQNGDDNLNVCPRALNGSKGKAATAFLNRYGTATEMPLRAVLLQDLGGRDRFNAKLARNIASVMGDAGDTLVPAIAEVQSMRRDVGGDRHAATLSFASLYRRSSEELQSQMTAMDLDRDGDGDDGAVATRTRRPRRGRP